MSHVGANQFNQLIVKSIAINFLLVLDLPDATFVKLILAIFHFELDDWQSLLLLDFLYQKVTGFLLHHISKQDKAVVGFLSMDLLLFLNKSNFT